eukprot:COSAG01_NODE_12845_length_1676_cov_1.986049_3_plen_74_part_00
MMYPRAYEYEYGCRRAAAAAPRHCACRPAAAAAASPPLCDGPRHVPWGFQVIVIPALAALALVDSLVAAALPL